ncbi:phospholipase A2 [Rhizohabitans arisaemae]|uniref:phospholipase A2 n=1 Tax=Rhizohabitans arisaemae TaxID=2720610 RepID=UPI0024B124EB|nr:phospholipase A2 [Rhizohabitans arisaemae]
MVSISLVATIAPSVSAEAAPVRPLTPVPTPRAACPAEAQDENSATLIARLCGKRVKISGLTTEIDEYFANPDGTTSREHDFRPVRVKRDQGWVPADATLVRAADGSIAPKAAALDVRFSGGGAGPLVRASLEGTELTLGSPVGALPTPTLTGATATYPEVMPGVDLQVTADVDGFSEKLIVKNRWAAANPALKRLSFPAVTKKGSLKADGDGNLTVTAASGKEVFVAPAAQMWDASHERSVKGLRVPGITTDTAEEGKRRPIATRIAKGALEVLPDTAMLTDPQARFPLVIDPGFTSYRYSWNYVESAYPTTRYHNTAEHARVGSSNGGSSKIRSFWNMNLAGMGTRKTIQAATFSAREIWAWSCSPRNVELHRVPTVATTVTWNTQPAGNKFIGAKNVAYGWSSAGIGGASSCPAAWVGWDVKTALQEIMNSGGTSISFMLKAASETDNTHWKRFENNPKLTVTYNTPPAAPTALTAAPCSAVCASPATVTSLRPTLKARLTDPDGQPVNSVFEVWTPNRTTLVTSGAVGDVASGSVASWTAPALTEGTTYHWRVRAGDRIDLSAWSAWQVFTVDTVTPVAPTITSADYPADDWALGAGQAGTFTITPANADAAAVLWSFDNGPQQSAAVTGGAAHEVVFTPATNGPHTLTAWVRDGGGNVSPAATYTFNAGSSAVTSPQDGSTTARRVTLSAAADQGMTDVTFFYRRGSADTWNQVPAADVRRRSDGSAVTWPVPLTGGTSPALVWDVARTLAEDGAVQIRARFGMGTAAPAHSRQVEITVDRNSGGAATQAVGPGFVNLLTGDFSFGAGDVSAFGVGVMRSYSSRDSEAAGSDGLVPVFGAPWTSTGLSEAAPSTYNLLRPTSATSLEIVNIEDQAIGFTKNADGTWSAAPGFADLTLTYTAGNDRYTLADSGTGNTTVFAKVDPAATSYPVRTVYPPTGDGTAVFFHEKVTGADGVVRARPTRIVSPQSPSPATCDVDDPATLPTGCRVLQFVYADQSTATAEQPGDYAGRVSRILLWKGGTATGESLAEYLYDADGRLRETWDPRIVPAAKTVYTYDAANRVTSFAPPGELPWTFVYGRVGNPETAGDGMLLKVSRPTLVQGSTTQTDGVATTSVVYDVPLAGAAAPYPMAAEDTATWGQADTPVDATAVFPPDSVPAAHTGVSGLDYRRATVQYFNTEGRSVNQVEPGGHVTTAEHDRLGNVIRSLSASNRALALGQGQQAAQDLTELGIVGLSTAQRARLLSTESVYNADGTRKESDLGPIQMVTLEGSLPAEGTLAALPAGSRVAARAATVLRYDEGRPTDGTAEVENVVTTSTVGARIAGRTTDGDRRSVRTYYDWTKGRILKTVEDPGGLALTKTMSYDSGGRLRESTMPRSDGNDAGTTVREYYTADGTGVCGGKPEWAGQLCRVRAKADATGGGAGPAQLVTKTYEYHANGRANRLIENVAGVTRTTVTEYDGAGRAVKVTVTGGLGVAVPEVTTEYDAAGRPVRITGSNGTVITRGYDALGRQVSYTDAAGGVTRAEYDALDRVVKKVDGAPSTTTYAYDHQREPRGLVTSQTDSVAGTHTATYDGDGAVIREDLPGGVWYGVLRNTVGTPVWRGYQSSTGAWLLNDSTAFSVHGRPIDHQGVSSQSYGYDAAGRLTEVKDRVGPVCTRRAYGYDANSNRTSLNTASSPPGGSCPVTGGTVKNHTYDTADRLVDSGYVYDAFGRTTATPEGESYEYHVNDLIASARSGDTRQTWSLDPQLRRNRIAVDRLEAGAWTPVTTRVDHFGSDDDKPSWTVENTSTGAVTRNVPSIAGALSAVTSATGNVRLQLLNLHDDVQVSYDLATGVPTVLDFDEFGNPRPGQATARYGWHGAAQRQADTPGGAVQMGLRLYQPKTGRFLQTDPVEGGGANSYDYAGQSPVGNADLDGRAWSSCRSFWEFAFVHCGMRSVWYAKKWRSVQWVKTAGGWWVRGIKYDNCTKAPDKPFGMDFRAACQMHDYGYALYRAGELVASKYQVDYVFWYVLHFGVCKKYKWRRALCYRTAYEYYTAVVLFGWP